MPMRRNSNRKEQAGRADDGSDRATSSSAGPKAVGEKKPALALQCFWRHGRAYFFSPFPYYVDLTRDAPGYFPIGRF